MIILNPRKITGPQLHRIVKKAIKDREKNIGSSVDVGDFCRIADISRQRMYEYANGQKPGTEGLVKVIAGLKAWGIEADIEISA